MKVARAMTIRLSAEQADQLDLVANVDNQPVSEVIRAAITAHVRERSRDKDFQLGLRARLDRARELLPDPFEMD